MKIVTQLNVQLKNSVGSLADLTDRLSRSSVNISAIACTPGKSTYVVHLVVDDLEKAKRVLKSHYKFVTEEALVIQVRNRPGATAAISRACADGKVNIKNIFCTTAGKGKEVNIYMIVQDDPNRVRRILRKALK